VNARIGAPSLRDELGREGIDVCTILPASIDTPFFQHAGNYTGRAAKPLPADRAPGAGGRCDGALGEAPRHEPLAPTAGNVVEPMDLWAGVGG